MSSINILSRHILPAALVWIVVPAMVLGQWANPVNLGPGVNSQYDENGLSDYGGVLYFTSDRPGMGGYDVYRSERIGPEWGPAVDVPLLNSPSNERAPAIACVEGFPEVVFGSDRAGTFDVWSSRNLAPCPETPPEGWHMPQPAMGGGYVDSMPWISPDGLTLMFGSNRPDGGDYDIWVSTRDHPGAPWGPPVNLGPVINTPNYDERGPSVSGDGMRLYFASNRPGLGGADIYMSVMDEGTGEWMPPVNLGPDINTQYQETCPTESEDGNLLLFGSTRPGGYGDKDLYAARRVSPPIPTVSEWGLIVMTLLLLTAGTILIARQRRRRPVAA